ncbi:hypothetical protein OQA88_5884 [Cercophora sp. LCS_1]
MRAGRPNGPLSLGHLVPDLRRLDQVINTDGFEPFPPGMEVIGPRRLTNFTWDESNTREVALLGKVGVPSGTGLDGSVTLGGLFSRKVRRYSEFGCLETWMVNPTRAYVARSLEGEEVKGHIERVKREVSSLVEIGPEVQVGRGRTATLEMEHVADFVWAVRLAKITKNGLQTDWKMETFTGRTSLVGRGAVFAPGTAKVDVGEVLGCHGLEGVEIVEDASLDCVFVANRETGPSEG